MSMGSTNQHVEREVRRTKFAVPIRCGGCGQVGSAMWEENEKISPLGPRAVLLEVSSGFYLRVTKKDFGRSEIVCSVCESIVCD